MLKQFSNAVALAALMALVGCAGNPALKTATPIQVDLPDAVIAAEDIYTEEATQEFSDAVRLLRKEGAEVAEPVFAAFVEKHPLVAGGHLNMALIRYHAADLEAAEDYVDECIRLSPRNPIAYNLKGKLLKEQGEFEEARVAYSKALASDPEYAPAHMNIGILYDIYLQYLLDAKRHYKIYLDLNGSESKTVKLWLQDLEFRIKRAGR